MSDSASTNRYPVLIAGAGPVGLALSIELAWRGIRCLVVEQTDGSVDFPTTNLANTRTCEHMRRWGIADRMRYESGYPSDYPRNYLFVTRMKGYEIARFQRTRARPTLETRTGKKENPDSERVGLAQALNQMSRSSFITARSRSAGPCDIGVSGIRISLLHLRIKAHACLTGIGLVSWNNARISGNSLK